LTSKRGRREFVSSKDAAELKQEQTFTIILPNLIHKSKKLNLTRWLPAACGGGQKNPSARGQKIFSPKTPPFFARSPCSKVDNIYFLTYYFFC